jgi:hypothetical protein
MAAVGTAILAPGGVCAAIGAAYIGRAHIAQLSPAYSMALISPHPGPLGVFQYRVREAESVRSQVADGAAKFMRRRIRLVWSNPDHQREP